MENDEFEFVCDYDQTIYEAAKMYGVHFDYEYDGGATDLSMARLNYGVIDLSKQSYLNARQIEEKLILLTVAYPKSDCEIDLNILQNNRHRLKAGPVGSVWENQMVHVDYNNHLTSNHGNFFWGGIVIHLNK